MAYMFSKAETFNQPLAFNTAKVTDVRAYIFLVSNPNEKWEIRFWFTINLLSGGCHVYTAEDFNQQLSFDTAEVTIVRLYTCSDSDRDERPGSDFPNPIQFIIEAAASNQPIYICQYCQGYNCESIYLFGVRSLWETRFWLSISYPTYYQMNEGHVQWRN